MRTHPVIFLDIDGVLIAYPEGEHTQPVFTPRCVEAFRRLLEEVPDAKVVFSSTWRLPQHVNRLHEQWTSNGFLEGLATDGTPDLRGDPETPRIHRRGLEIKAWLDANTGVDRWVALDDDRDAIEPVLGWDRCAFTDPARGLTEDDVERALLALQYQARVR